MSVSLFEVLVAAQRMPTEGEFLVRISHYPAAGKTGEFVAPATEMTKKLQGDGLVINLVSQLFSSEGAVLQSVLTLRNLIEWQGFQKRVRSDSSIQDWVKAVAAISRCPLTSEIWEPQSLPTGR
ncbi:MAG: hypothetical protein HY678_03540 [Chloroflexi bacterium]|nr:hypothetical protein [Chloroflexota bacterium]